MRAPALIVDAARAMARLAPDIFGVRPLSFEAHVRGSFEIASELGMTFRAGLRTDEFGARDLGRGDERAGRGRAVEYANGSDHRAQNDNSAATTATQLTTNAS